MSQVAGRLITFEGGDGTGKSTQLRMTQSWLREQGHQVLVTHEPGYPFRIGDSEAAS